MEQENNNWFYRIFLKSWRPFFWLILVGFLIYSQALFFNFTYFDDDLLILNNQNFIKDLSNILQAFKEDVFLSFFDVYYRPMLTVSFILDAQFSGTLPFGYHLSNLLMHLISTCLIFVLLKKLDYKKELCFLFGLIFAIHPIFSQAVAWIPGRNDPLLALFLLPCFIFFIDYLKRKSWFYLFWHLVFFFLAIFTKETAIFILPIIILYLLLIKREGIFSPAKIITYAGWFLIFIIWFIFRKNALENTITLNIVDVINSLFASFPVIIQYLGKIIFPFNLSVFPIIRDTSFIYGILAVILIATAVLMTKNLRLNYFIFGLGWFFFLITPTMMFAQSVAVPTFLEHRMYLPIIGILIIILETGLIKNLNEKKLWLGFLFFFIIFLPINIIHSKNFKSRTIFWETAAASSPHSGFVQKNLGYIYYLDHRPQEAMAKFNQALWLNPKELLAHYHIGNIYLNQNLLKEAEREYIEELKINPLFDNALYNLGLVYSKLSDFEKAEFYWQKTLESNPKHPEALNSLSLIYLNEKKYVEAETLLNNAVQCDPSYDGAYQNLGLLYFQQGKLKEAEAAWNKALEISPQLLKVRENLIILYLQQKDMAKAIFYYNEIKKLGGQVQPELLKILNRN